MTTLTKALLATATVAVLHKMGFRPFDTLKGILGLNDDKAVEDEIPNVSLWLIPAELHKDIPTGVQVTDIFGNVKESGKDKLSKDQMDGLLPYGVLRDAEETDTFIAECNQATGSMVGAECKQTYFAVTFKSDNASSKLFSLEDFNDLDKYLDLSKTYIVAVESMNSKPTGRKPIEIERDSIKAFGPKNKAISESFTKGLIESNKVDSELLAGGLVVVLMPPTKETEGKRILCLGYANDIRLVMKFQGDEHTKGSLSVGDMIVLATTLKGLKGEPIKSIRAAFESFSYDIVEDIDETVVATEDWGVYKINVKDDSTSITIDDLISGDYKVINFQGIQRFGKLEKKFSDSSKDKADDFAKEQTKSGDPDEIFRVANIRTDF